MLGQEANCEEWTAMLVRIHFHLKIQNARLESIPMAYFHWTRKNPLRWPYLTPQPHRLMMKRVHPLEKHHQSPSSSVHWHQHKVDPTLPYPSNWKAMAVPHQHVSLHTQSLTKSNEHSFKLFLNCHPAMPSCSATTADIAHHQSARHRPHPMDTRWSHVDIPRDYLACPWKLLFNGKFGGECC